MTNAQRHDPADGEVLIVGEANLPGGAGPRDSLRHVAARLGAADAVIGQMEGMVVAGADTGPDPSPCKPGWRHSPPKATRGRRGGMPGPSPPSPAPRTWPIRQQPALKQPRGWLARGWPAPVSGRPRPPPAILDLAVARIGLQSCTSVFHRGLLTAGPDRPGCAVLPAQTAYLPGRRALEMPGAPPEVRTWPDPEVVQTLRVEIAAQRPRVDLLLVSRHWGLSGATAPAAYQTALAEVAAEAGADLVFGHHPHVIQGAARVRGTPCGSLRPIRPRGARSSMLSARGRHRWDK